MQYVTLNNNLNIPQIGYGLWQVSEEDVTKAVTNALEVGYRLFDTATLYGNESGVGEALSNSTIPREELFVTTKVWNSNQGYDNTLKSFNKSLNDLKLDYLDLYLIHWPAPKNNRYVETYKALEKLHDEGLVKAIGVCNFEIEHLQRVLNECDIKPVVNQVECHPFLQQLELKKFCKEQQINLEAWSPLMSGGEVLKHKCIQTIAKKHNRTAAQIIIRWHIQSDTIVIPKSITPSRMKENFQVFDFELTPEEMQEIAQLNQNIRTGPEPNKMN